MKMTKLMGWILFWLGLALGMLAIRDSFAQTATAVPMTPPQGSATPMMPPQGSAIPAGETTPAPALSAAPAATSGDATSNSGSGQGSRATPASNSAVAPVSVPVPQPAPKPVAPPPKPQTELTPVDKRITDQAIRGDMAFIRTYQARLKGLNDTGDNPNTAYQYAKALHWVDFALDEYEMKNRSGVIDQALAEGARLIEALEQKRTGMSMETTMIPLSVRVRDDLWVAAEKLKADKDGFKCSGGDVARLEVQLVWAGHIQRDLGWRSAKPHLQAAERYYRDAVAGAETCPRPVAAKEAPKQAIDDAALAKLPPAKQIEILADRVHFAYDRATISLATATVLDRVASLLRGNPAISVTIEGHADERGSETYNVKLSQRRADTVRAYLMAAGVDAARLKTQAFGKSKPEVKAENIEGHALNRRVVLVPSMPSAQDFQINRQRDDLQTKGDPATGKSKK